MIGALSPHLRPRNSFYELKGLVSSGGRVADGREQRVQDDVGFWRVIYSFAIRNRAQALAYRNLVRRLRAGESIVATVFDNWTANPSPAIGLEAKLAADADLRATTIQLATVGLALEEGVSFSIGDRLYSITEIVSHAVSVVHHTPDAEVPDPAVPYPDNPPAYPDQWTVKILPPLRSDVAANTPADFINLRCLCVIENVTDGDLDLDLGFFGDPTLSLIETI